jgi:serine beta-lactamase-like protein LACTB, mitochondrial
MLSAADGTPLEGGVAYSFEVTRLAWGPHHRQLPATSAQESDGMSRSLMAITTVAVTFWCGCAPKPTTEEPVPSNASTAQAVRAVEQFITDTMRTLGAPGASICVVRDGHVLWSHAFGFADLEQNVPATTETRFRIGSVSKSLTSVAIGRLVQDGRLDLDSPVQRYAPRFPVKRSPITVRQVAGHLAGIRHYLTGEFENREHYGTVSEGLTIFAADSLLFSPGTEFSYSSYGYNLLGAVIEGASGRSYLEYMRDVVLTPAEMTHTSPEHPDSIIPHRGRYYTRADSTGPILNALYVDNTYKWPSGGYLSTAEDLARFGDRLLRGQLLLLETVELLWTSMRTSDGTPTEYGIGWTVERDSLGRRRVRHSGGSVGGTAHLIIYPDERLVVAVLVNSDYTFINAIPRYAEPFLPAGGATTATPARARSSSPR